MPDTLSYTLLYFRFWGFARSSAKVLSTVLRVGIHRDGLVEVDFRAKQRNFAASGAKGIWERRGCCFEGTKVNLFLNKVERYSNIAQQYCTVLVHVTYCNRCVISYIICTIHRARTTTF